MRPDRPNHTCTTDSRLYDVTSGAVLVGGVDVRNYDLGVLRRSVAMVCKNVLGTIADNLRWGDANATDEMLQETCKMAQAHNFITSFPEGYNTHMSREDLTCPADKIKEYVRGHCLRDRRFLFSMIPRVLLICRQMQSFALRCVPIFRKQRRSSLLSAWHRSGCRSYCCHERRSY